MVTINTIPDIDKFKQNVVDGLTYLYNRDYVSKNLTIQDQVQTINDVNNTLEKIYYKDNWVGFFGITGNFFLNWNPETSLFVNNYKINYKNTNIKLMNILFYFYKIINYRNKKIDDLLN